MNSLLLTSTLRCRLWITPLILLCLFVLVRNASAQVDDEIQKAVNRFPNFEVISVKGMSGKIHLQKFQGLTSYDLVGVQLQDDPPVLRQPQRLTDDQPKPYIATGIHPFRLNHFNCQFNYGGKNNYSMQDYASTHGFDSIYPYRRTDEQISRLPADTKIARWKGIAKYRNQWWKDQNLPKNRYDLLNAHHFWSQETKDRKDQNNRQTDSMMLDMEHSPPLELKTLKQQSWHPNVNQTEFAQDYYAGYAQSLTSTVQSYRNQGFETLSIYGWSPLERSWFPMLSDQPLSREAWDRYGKHVANSVDVIHNSVYCPYADFRNVAYVLAGIDENVRRVQELDKPKPVQPYFWPLISGGGSGDDRWWREVPHPSEDQEAMIAMSFFLGIDGIVIWNWSGSSSHHVASFDTFMGKPAKRSLMVGKSFWIADTNGHMHLFDRYDYLSVSDAEHGMLKFQKILPNDKAHSYGISPDQPAFLTKFDLLSPYLRPRSEPVAGIIRALALIKPFELSIRQGIPEKDFDLREAFRKKLPLYRRVKNGNYHIIITYAPQTIRTGQESEVTIEDFAGNKDLDLVFPADHYPRIFVITD